VHLAPIILVVVALLVEAAGSAERHRLRRRLSAQRPPAQSPPAPAMAST
jgi:hypothetical protein